MRRMRWVVCALVIAGSVERAAAADFGFPTLRGSTYADEASGRWDGFYVGAQAGYNWSSTNFSGATQSLVSFILRNTTIENEQHVSNWTTLGKYDANGTSFGGFAGYQVQWEGAVVGIEANYNRTSISAAAGDRMRRTFSTSDGYSNDVQVNAQSGVHITDYGTLRVRGGWVIDCFMPYGFVGVAVGRADVTSSARVIASGFDTTGSGNPPYSSDQTKSETKNGAFAYGWTLGAGLEMMLARNLFLRGEYEYIQFGNFNGLATNISTARVAAGFKF